MLDLVLALILKDFSFRSLSSKAQFCDLVAPTTVNKQLNK